MKYSTRTKIVYSWDQEQNEDLVQVGVLHPGVGFNPTPPPLMSSKR